MGRDRRESRGFTLIELLVAIVIMALVVVGVAYTLSTSRSFVDRFALAREALARAEWRLEELQYPAAPADTMPGAHFRPLAPPLWRNVAAEERLVVSYVDDPADGLAGLDFNMRDYKQITVTITWTAGFPDSVRLTSYFAAKP